MLTQLPKHHNQINVVGRYDIEPLCLLGCNVNSDFSQHLKRFRVDFVLFQACAENLRLGWQEFFAIASAMKLGTAVVPA